MSDYLTFVVRLARTEGDDFDGIVERVRTGEKARFRGVDALGPTIRRMTGKDLSDARLPTGSDALPSASLNEATDTGPSESQC